MDVLDVAVDNERIVVVTAEDGDISVWFLGFGTGDSPRARLSAGIWNGSSGPILVSRENVDAKLGRNGWRLTLTVTTRGELGKRCTVYEQVSANGWPMKPAFKVISQEPSFKQDELLDKETD